MVFCPRRTRKSEEENDEDSGNGLVGAGGDRAGERTGTGWAYCLPIGSTTNCGRRGSERRVCCGVESGDGRVGRRGRGCRCRCEPGGRINCGRALDNSKKRATVLEQDRDDARTGGSAGEDERAAERPGVGIRDRVLRRSRRRNADGGEQGGWGFSSGPGAGVGSGSTEGQGAGDSRGAGTVRDYFGARGRCAAENDAAIQDLRRGKAGFRAALVVVVGARRRRRDFAIGDRERFLTECGEYRVAATAAKRSVHICAGAGDAPAGAVPCSRSEERRVGKEGGSRWAAE